MQLSTKFQTHSLKTRVTLFTLVIFLISIWSLSFYASRVLRNDLTHQLSEQQFATVSLVAGDIDHELAFRLNVLTSIAAGITPSDMGNTSALQTLLARQPVLEILFNGGVLAINPAGTAIAEVPRSAQRIGINYADRDFLIAALTEGKSTIGQLVMGKKPQLPIFGMTVPIRDSHGTVIGALAGVINLGLPNFLDEITDNRYGKTGGFLLVAPQHRRIVTGTDKSRVMEASPAPGIYPLIDRFLRGYEGSGVGVNPRGVEVLASAKSIPVAGWYVSAALPTAEAFAPIHALQQHILIATLLLTLLAGSLTWWMLRRELVPLLDAAKTLTHLSNSNQPLQALPIRRQDEIGQLIGGFNHLLQILGQRQEALKESETRFRTLADNASDLDRWRGQALLLLQQNLARLYRAQSCARNGQRLGRRGSPGRFAALHGHVCHRL